MLELTFIILSYSQLDAHFWGVSEVPLLKGWIVCGGLVLTSQQLSELQKTFYQTRNLFQFAFTEQTSVTRLDNFCKFLAVHFLTNVAVNIWSLFGT